MVTLRHSTDLRFVELPGRHSADPFSGVGDLDVSVRLVRMEAGQRRRPHRHPHSCEVVHVLSGAGHVWQDGARAPVSTGDTFVVGAGVPHATLPLLGSHLELVCFFPHPDLSRNLEELDGPELG
jgi:quercetin dioxygenase-like cupin family protein